MALEAVRMNPDYLTSLEVQLEQKEEEIKKLKHFLEEKEELLLATSEKLCLSEKGKVEIENNFLAAKSDVEPEDNFVCSNWRAARLEAENNALKSRLLELSNEIDKCVVAKNPEIENITNSNNENETNHETGTEEKTLLQRLKELSDFSKGVLNSFGLSTCAQNLQNVSLCGAIISAAILDPEAVKVLSAENVQLHVRMELEHERRIRTQLALDEAERNWCSARRELENRARDLDELQESSSLVKQKFEKKVKILGDENRRLRACIKEKEAKISESEARAKLLSVKAEEFEEMFNIQLETVKTLQSDLAVASTENQVLVHEMETLSKMFNAMEQRYVSHALDEYTKDSNSNTEDGTNLVEDVLKADEADSKVSSLQESCFKEVTTKNGTRMVLSVSKTFMKLKDLILEKKSLEDRVEKMKAINTQLVSRVNLHEAKLYNITDELNKTWTYVSTLKLQHKQLHTSEQILRAELAEKRELLAKLREELELSRESWILVKKKTADSEKEWRALRDEFAERRRMFTTASSESGFSDAQTEEEEEEEDHSVCSEPSKTDSNQIIEANTVPGSNQLETGICTENEMSESTVTIKAPEESTEESQINDIPSSDILSDILPQDILSNDLTIPIFVPPLDYVAGVPPEFLPSFFPSEDPVLKLGLDGVNDASANVPVDENYEELYSKLIASAARSAALANRLAEIHRNLTTHSENDVIGCGDGDDDDVEPRTEEEDDAESSDLHSESDFAPPETDDEHPVFDDQIDSAEQHHELSGAETDTDSSDLELEDLGLSPEAIERALASSGRKFSEDSDIEDDLEDDSDTTSAASVNFEARGESSTAPEESETEEGEVFQLGLPVLQSQECASYAIPIATVAPMPSTSRGTASAAARQYSRPDYANQDSIDETEDSSEDEEDCDLASENATAVTRFLIKTFPKQLSKLRNEKTELEERIQDLEARISDQNSAFSEMERRTEIYRKEAETARKWTSSIGAINFGKGSDESHKLNVDQHHHCSCGRLPSVELEQTFNLCPGKFVKNIVEVTNPGETINWTIQGCSKEMITTSVYFRSLSGEMLEQAYIISEDMTGDVTYLTCDVTDSTSDVAESASGVTESTSKATESTRDVTHVTVTSQQPGHYILKVASNDANKKICVSDIAVQILIQEK